MNKNSDIIRSIIDRENELLNHRVTWMTTLQGLLFAALAFGIANEPLKLILCGMGIILAILSAFGIFASTKAVYRQYDWWLKHKPGDYDGPEVIGYPPFCHHKFFRHCTAWIFIPLVMIVGWVLILFYVSP